MARHDRVDYHPISRFEPGHCLANFYDYPAKLVPLNGGEMHPAVEFTSEDMNISAADTGIMSCYQKLRGSNSGIGRFAQTDIAISV
jgi:hypothetical protein